MEKWSFIMLCHRPCIYMLLFAPELALIVTGSLLDLKSSVAVQNIFMSVGSSIVTRKILLIYYKL